ncbi:kinase-like protein [Ceratobasidium sp. AG-Ba]|nr:kinase-like protein [Ceratobasidium sp. AG-Ba]
MRHVAYHVFLPPHLPQQAPHKDHERRIDHQLVESTLEAVQNYRKTVPENSGSWACMTTMLQRLSQTMVLPLGNRMLSQDMANMQYGDVLALHIREQNAAVIIRKSMDATTFEVFEAQAPNQSVMSTPGKLVRHFPGPAIEVPNSIVGDPDFIAEIANFLAQMNVDVLEDATAKTRKAGSQVAEVRDAADPRYITQLFTGILRGYGHETEPRRVVKRIADEVLWDTAYLPWRRSPIWLIIRVALQTSVDSLEYKHFMIFVHAHLLGLLIQQSGFDNDLLAAMRIKMSRRMLKVKDSLPEPIIQFAKDAVDRAQSVMQARWQAVQDGVARFSPLKLETERAVVQSLPNSRAYLTHVLKGRSSKDKPPAFNPTHEARLTGQGDFSIFSDGALTRAFNEQKHFALFDFESAVHRNLSSWVDRNLHLKSPAPCRTISSCIDQYASTALSYYTQDIADRSIAMLTIMELWVALDRLVTSRHGLLLQYSPEIPEDLIEPLLLRSSVHLERAQAVQTYIRGRHRDSSYGSVFTATPGYNSLSIRFFAQSSSLQNLKRDIENDAQREKQDKIKELDRLNDQHADLETRISRASCTYHEDHWGYQRHDRWCRRCSMVAEAGNMSISVHEWPLPSETLDAQNVVFELQCPEEIDLWRSATYKALCDLGGSTREGEANPHCKLDGYDGLSSRVKHPRHRITIASTTKSFIHSHYRTTKIPSVESMVCVNNGLRFQLFDSHAARWASAPFSNTSFAKYGTFNLPTKSLYRYLQYSLESTEHTSNQVLADQSDCPKELSLHEHYAFGTLRSGPRLQWMNIVRGLEENILTFSREEVDILHTQAAWQIGVLDRDGQTRDWHVELENPDFGILLVAQASRVLDRVRSNWLEGATVHTIVTLVARLLSSTTDPSVQNHAYRFLRDARAVAFAWLDELSLKLRDAELESQILDYQERVCEMALICRSAYDVDDRHLRNLLYHSDDYLALICCSITIHDNQPPRLDRAPQHLQTLICRDRRLSYKTFPILVEKIRNATGLLDSPAYRCWNGYQPSSAGWVVLPEPNSRWVTTSTAGDSNSSSQEVHLNLLEGKLLVDGQPLGRLPREYVIHPTYARLFGQRVLDVVPASASGMVFATRAHINKYQISFCLDKNGELIIQAHQGRVRLELVPYLKLLDDFPLFFSSDYHHWINLDTGVVEFRSLAQPWVTDHANWRLQFSTKSVSIMEKCSDDGSRLLVDVHSPTFQDISCQIAPLESTRHVHVTRSGSNPSDISAELPRMKIAFFVNEDKRLESRNFPGQVIQENQSSGTMFGLKDQLVLCAKDPVAASLPRSRAVLIPYGEVGFASRGDHMEVTVHRGSGRYATFCHYKIDSDMGYLANSNNDLTSRLFKIYLHALTSHCLPDPLTGRTGTEEALYELSESATSSFDQINEEQAQLLKQIGELTPKRVYYPAHLQVMQTTDWNSLPALSQHYAFCTAANSVIRRADSLQLFKKLDFKLKPYTIEFEEALLRRAAYRTRTYYPIGTVDYVPNVLEDQRNGDENTWYSSKDHPSEGWTEDGQRASWACELVRKRWGMPTHATYDLLALFERWGIVHGPASDLRLTYGRGWLQLTLSSLWLSMYNLCRRAAGSNNQYALGICLAAGVYSGSLPSELVPVLVAFAANPSFQSLNPPAHSVYDLSDKYLPTEQRISQLIGSAIRDIESTPSSNIPRNTNESAYNWEQRRKRHYDSNTSSLRSELTRLWFNCWPHSPTTPSSDYSSWFNINTCLLQVQSYFDSCSRNVDLKEHLHRVGGNLSSGSTTPGLKYTSMLSALPLPKTSKPVSARLLPWLAVGGLINHRAVPSLIEVPLKPPVASSMIRGGAYDTSQLETLLAEFHTSSTRPLCRRYGSDLETSRLDLSRSNTQAPPLQLPSLSRLERNRSLYHGDLLENLELIRGWLGPTTPLEDILFMSGIWPRITPRTILSNLGLRARKNIPQVPLGEFKKFARSYIEYQRSQRLIALAQDAKHDEFFKEMNLANADSSEEANHPDWMLVQIDGNFSSRVVQTQVAREMVSPSSAASTVLQLNMGEGKSSVIVPIIAAALADTSQLVRVVVLKPLWRQMFHLLVGRLAGLVNRRVYYLPFGRHIQVGESQAELIHTMYEECMREGGILLVQPEHILSFKLMGIDQLISSSTSDMIAASKSLRKTQEWLLKNSRDILDESDEILHVRYQLVYTVGGQGPLEGHPDRWTTTQQVLSRVAHHINHLKQSYPEKLKYENRKAGQFPLIRIMPESNEIIATLVQLVAQDSIAGEIPSLNFNLLPRATREVALRFIINRDISEKEASELQNLDSSMRGGLLLLRGLLACGIIAFALKDKHYRVDYGLHLSRSLLAVPYHAKDIPSLRAEFGHPDVAVVLTCLSYYNSGLTDSQLDTCFELLYKLDNPALEYEQWVSRNEATPPNLRQLSGVNLKDREQFSKELVPVFARNSVVVDFFLSSVVFPKEAKQFPHKLSTSGWDLAEIKEHVTTGFSGTNDNRYLLPTSIAQSDPVKQSSTNALVLTYLLRPENNHYLCIRGTGGETCSAKEFMKILVKQDPEIRVLLDVGAQMLELKNDELVKYWLSLRPDIAAAVYFSDDHELVILPQNGSPTPFDSSPFSQQMDRCIVYLDDGHTRGTDLKLPQGTRAAVTLGPKVTKDRLLQGCMRMRKLGSGQSVMFCAPPEIDDQIRKAAKLTSQNRIDALDVIRWAMLETCKDLEHHISHWAQQGVEYNRRLEAQKSYASGSNIETLKQGWMTPESRSLEEMYGVSSSATGTSESFTRTALGFPSLKKRLDSLGVRKLEDPSMDEEQEREVSHEVERERQIERPPKSQPASHAVHPDIKRFVATGSLSLSASAGVVSLFHALEKSGASQPGTWSSNLLATLDFCKALAVTSLTELSEYMRPLNWVLSGPGGVLLAMSPYEVDQLLPDIRKSAYVRLHVFAPRVIQSMLSFSDLQFYSPASSSSFKPSPPDLLLQLQLGLFAGQLYFEDYISYRALTGFLGIFIGSDHTRESEDIQVQSDGFVGKADRQKLSVHVRDYFECEFTNSPISALKDLIGHRRKGMEYLRTHLGQMLHARQLTPNDFQSFSQS